MNENKVIITTRSRIARNIDNFRFGSINSIEEKKEIINMVKDIFFYGKINGKYNFFSLNKLTKIQRQFLVERHVMSQEMNSKLNGKGLITNCESFNRDNLLSIMINEEDHLRIQCVNKGLNIRQSYNEISKIEKKLDSKLKFSYDKDFGYLTACPTNLGTGLRISVIAHLPALVVSSGIEEFIKNLNKTGYGVRGYFGENSDVIGNLFQISNQISLGKYEEQIIEEMDAVCLNIIDAEKNAVEDLKKTKAISVEDSVFRSYGMLRYAKILSYCEALELLSMIKLGQELNLVCNIKNFDMYDLINLMGDSNLLLNFTDKNKKNIKNDEIDKIRADLIKNKILKGIDINV